MFTGITSFVLVYGTLNLLSWSFHTVTASQISNIEKAFGLTSSETGWLLTAWEIGFGISTIFASYFGPRAHLPRVIGLTTILCGLCGIILSLPHFVSFSESNVNVINTEDKNETQAAEDSDVTLCVNNSHTPNGTSDEPESTAIENNVKRSGKTIAYILFNIGMILQGASRAPCFPYCSQYVDDNVDKQKTGFYIGAISSIAVFGFALGYGMGSLTGSIYVTLKSTDLSTTDTRYIGAWWLGFIVLGLATLLIAVPMFFFPRRLTTKQSGTANGNVQQRQRSIIDQMKEVASTLLSNMKSPIYVLTVLASCFQVLSLSTFLGFEPKYMETQFAIPPWQVNILLGVISITSYSIGCLVGGYITKKWSMTPFQMILMIISLLAFVTVVLVIAAFLGCSQQTIYNSPNDQTSSNTSLNIDCDCTSSEFLPICGNDGKNYYSPCHAGCVNLNKNVLTNCSNIPGGVAKMGLCPSRCNMVWPYSVAKFFMNLVDAIASIPVFLVFLRSAGAEHKTLAIGLSAAITSLTAWLPGPVIGGKLIDSTCLIWNTARTSGKYCAFYNIEGQRYRMHGLMIGLRVVALSILCAALVKAKVLPTWPREEKEYRSSGTQENGKQLEELALS